MYLNNGENINECQSCKSKKIIKFLSLGDLPIANDLFLINSNIDKQMLYPTELFYCENCFLVQLGFLLKPEIVFPKNFPYTSSSTKALRDNFKELAELCIKKFNIKKDDLVLDIGSNDGNLLSFFKNDCNVLGVTPEDIGKIAIQNGIPTIINFFTNEISKKIIKENGKATLITSTNTFAHVPNVNDFIQSIRNILTDDGVFISESHYFYNLFETFQFDTIYHEHLRYYSLHSLKYLLERNNLEIFEAQQISTHGGSIRIFASKKGKYNINDSVTKILSIEKNIISLKKLQIFSEKINMKKNKLLNLIKNINKNNQKIYGIGAAARASTLLNYVKLNDYIDKVLEVGSSKKIGFYMSGTKIPICDEEVLLHEKPDYLLLLSWHIADIIIPKFREKGYKGKFILPLPDPKIIN